MSRHRLDAKEILHDGLVQRIADRLKRDKGYDDIKTRIEYGDPDTVGECDVLTFRNGKYTYYEVKGRHHSKGISKAKGQLKRWRDYHPELETRMVYVGLRGNGSLRARRIR